MRTTIVLARHGRTEWHHGNRYTGSTDLPIDEVGVQQARLLKEWAAGYAPDALWSSPMLRARQTIAMGETYDFELTPERAGTLRIEIRGGLGGRLLARVPVRVD